MGSSQFFKSWSWLQKLYRISTKTSLFVLGLAVIADESYLFAETHAKTSGAVASSFNCYEFKNIYAFILSSHLRFQNVAPEVAKAESEKILQSSQTRMAETLRFLGYPMVAANFENIVLPKLKSQQKQTSLQSAVVKTGTVDTQNEFCESLGNSLLKAAYLKTYARSLDPYSDFYLSEELETKSSVIDGEFIGVGIGTDPKEDYLEVTEVVEDGPADGRLMLGDKIYKIDGHPVRGLNEVEIRKRIRGQENTEIRFSGLRNQQEFSVAMLRGRIHQKSTSYAWMKDRVLMIKIHRFFRQTADEVEAILAKNAGQAKGLILDLRNNPGGLLQAARDVVDLFISQGVVTYLKGKEIEDQIWALRDGGYLSLPIVTLVNQGTASAAEIVAGALQDYGRSVVIGQRTYGKGSVQNVYETQQAVGTLYKGGLKITTLWYYLPSGRSVVSKLNPDISLPAPEDEKPFAHADMPYHGEERIRVAGLPSYATIQNWIGGAKFSGRKDLRNMKSSEEVGQAILKGRFANR